MQEKMIILVGESGSGKSSIQNVLGKRFGVEKVVTYTTRPMRAGEVDGVDYHFITDEKFDEMVQNDEFAEYASYRGWKYGTASSSCGKANTVAALTPAGLRSLRRKGIPNVSFYLKLDRRTRLIRILNRGDDIEEAYRRSLSDVGQFDAVDREVDEVIKIRVERDGDLHTKTAKEAAIEIYEKYRKACKEKKTLTK